MSEFRFKQEVPEAWRARTRAGLRAAQVAWERTGKAVPSPQAEAFLDATAAAVEVEERLAGFSPAPGEAQLPFYRPLACGHAGANRRCLACGWLLCANCQPASAGAACARCAGPVYAEGEVRPVSEVRPFVEGY